MKIRSAAPARPLLRLLGAPQASSTDRSHAPPLRSRPAPRAGSRAPALAPAPGPRPSVPRFDPVAAPCRALERSAMSLFTVSRAPLGGPPRRAAAGAHADVGPGHAGAAAVRRHDVGPHGDHGAGDGASAAPRTGFLPCPAAARAPRRRRRRSRPAPQAFGTGSAIARQAVGAASNAMFGGSSGAAPAAQDGGPAAATQMQSTEVCEIDKNAFYQCLQTNNGQADKCSDLFNALSMCQENAKFSSANA